MEYDTINGDWEYPGFSYLNESLVSAIIDGDEAATIVELARQKRTETTDDISNHLIARGHWLYQKSRLTSLHDSLKPTTRAAVTSELQACIRDLNEHFTEAFISEDVEHPYYKLSGDESFRAAVVSSNDIARHIIAIDQNRLKSPGEMLEYVARRHHILIRDLERAPWDVNLDYWGAKSVIIDRMKAIICSRREDTDRELLKNLARPISRSPL